MGARFALLWSVAVACGGSPAPKVERAAPAPAPVAPVATVPAAPSEPDTPLDPQIRLHTLPNGMKVYVMPHKKPEDRASLWLAVNAGSVLEDNDQRGLAHFVEHMAFNGTKHFAKQAIVDYIEKIGMQFGADVNAYTSFDQTVYMLTVPTDDAKAMATGLDILRDWAGDVSFEPVEVDKERGVVLEEWRLGRGPFARIDDKQWPVMFQGSRYAERLPIGLPDILKTAPRDTLVRFYKTWYRPENMAVIAVGDFDAAAIEKEIDARFGSLVSTGDKRVREPVPVPHDQPTAVTIETDPEMPFSQVQVIDKLDHRPERTQGDYRRMIVENLYHAMLRARFDQLALSPDAPFTSAGSWTSSLTRTADGFTRYATAKSGKTAEALTVLVREIARVEQHGFHEAELDRAKQQVLSEAERSANEWDKTQSPNIADEMTRHFFEAEQMGGRPVELAMTRAMLPTVTRAELDHLAQTWSHDRGRVIALSGPASAKMPSEAEVRELVAAAAGTDVSAWYDPPAQPLMTALPTPGKVTATTRDEAANATVWTLSNGVRVIVKPTTFQNDSVQLTGWKRGGGSLVDDPGYARYAAAIVATGGVGALDPITLAKSLAGKLASAEVGMTELAETASGSARLADLETMFQLLHLRLTAPRKDPGAFAAWREDQLEWARNRLKLPEVSFYDDMNTVYTGNHARRRPVTPEMLGKLDLDKAHAVFAQRFGDLSGFTFVIVGNVDLATLQPLVERYLGSLPGKGARAKWKDIGVRYATGKIQREVLRGTEPKSYVSMTFGAPATWSRDAARDAQVLGMVLDIRLREVLREDMGGVYGAWTWIDVERQPTVRREAHIQFGCDPANVAKLRDATFTVIHDIEKNGIGDVYLEKVREQLERARETDAKENWWWSNQLREAYWYGDKLADATNLEAILARVTSDRIKAAAKVFFDEKNVVIGVLRPER